MAATGEGRELWMTRVVSATRALPAGVGDGELLDAGPRLEDTLVSLHLAVLAGRPWPQGES